MALPSSIRQPSPTPDQIRTVCFRVTRACNLKCPYCQAPPNGHQLPVAQLKQALQWLASQGGESIKFTGGEPFVHPNLLDLIDECRSLGMEPTVVTNGTLITDEAVECFARNGVRAKLSLHGPKAINDELYNADIFDVSFKNLQKLVAASVDTSVHSLCYHGSELDKGQWVEFLWQAGVKKVSFMPFIQRGRGAEIGQKWSLTDEEVAQLQADIEQLGDTWDGKIVVRYLDFLEKPYIVFETHGKFVIEYASEQMDEILPITDHMNFKQPQAIH